MTYMYKTSDNIIRVVTNIHIIVCHFLMTVGMDTVGEPITGLTCTLYKKKLEVPLLEIAVLN